MNRRTLAFALATSVTGVVVYLSTGGGLQLPQSFAWQGLDKAQHLAAYATLGVLWSYAFGCGDGAGSVPWQRLWGALFALGALLEVFQWAFFPNRYFEVADMLANGIGAGIGTLGFNRIFPT